MKLRQHALVAALLAIVAIWPTWQPLIRVWSDTQDYRHGPLVALITLVWLVRASGRIAPDPHARRMSWQATALLAATLAVWLVAYKANVEIGKQALAPVLIWLAIATAAGWGAARAMSAPLLYFYFAIPVWDLLVPLLQWMTVAVSEGALGVAGIPVHIEGLLIRIPEGSFIVLEACSGERYLIVTLAAAALLAAASAMNGRRTALYLGLTAGMAILANWLRVITIIVAGHVTDMKSYLVAREHVSFGWAVFAVLILLVPLLGRKLSHAGRDDNAHPALAPSDAAGSPARLAIATALLCMPAVAIGWISNMEMSAAAQKSVAVPRAGSGWHRVAASQRWLPTFLGSSQHELAALESEAGVRVETYWAVYGTQGPGAKLIYYSNSLASKGWLTLSSSSSHRVLEGRTVTMRTLLTQAPGGGRWLIDYYYVVDDVRLTHEWDAQLLYGLLSWLRPTPSAVIAAAAPCGSSCELAQQALSQYWASAAPERPS
jgi:EpsI family protein